eukprot:471020-Alexandrium_andersonii.AAC.1
MKRLRSGTASRDRGQGAWSGPGPGQDAGIASAQTVTMACPATTDRARAAWATPGSRTGLGAP